MIDFGIPLDDSGRVAFPNGAKTIGASSLTGLWTGTAGQLQLIAKQGDAAPGAIGGAMFGGFRGMRPTLNGAGTVAFRGFLTAPYDFISGGADGVWRVAVNGALEPMALVYEKPVGAGDEAQFTGFRSLRIPLNRAGAIGIQGDYNLTGGTEVEGVGLWTESGVGLEPRAPSNMPVPQFGASASASVTTIGGIDAAGNIAFNGTFFGAESGPTHGQLIGVARANGLQVIASTGAPAPGAGDGHVFNANSFVFEPAISSGGRVAFYAEEFDGVNFNTTRRRGVWAGPADAIDLVAREGDPAAETGMQFGAVRRCRTGDQSLWAGRIFEHASQPAFRSRCEPVGDGPRRRTGSSRSRRRRDRSRDQRVSYHPIPLDAHFPWRRRRQAARLERHGAGCVSCQLCGRNVRRILVQRRRSSAGRLQRRRSCRRGRLHGLA